MGGGPVTTASKSAAKKAQPDPEPEPEKSTRSERQEASARRARRRRGGIRSLLSPTREQATQGLGGKLSGAD